MNVAGELLAEAQIACCCGESSDIELFWFPPGSLLRIICDILPVPLWSGEWLRAGRLSSILNAIFRVHWSKINPRMVPNLQQNNVGAPIYENGEFVPWDTVNLSLAFWSELVLHPSGIPEPWGLENFGHRLLGDYSDIGRWEMAFLSSPRAG